jgi:hypothetical protein
MKSGSLIFLEPSGPVKAYNGIALPLLYLKTNLFFDCLYAYIRGILWGLFITTNKKKSKDTSFFPCYICLSPKK